MLIWSGILTGTGLAIRELRKQRNKIDMHGQIVLITGGSRGLGLAMAHEFARQGARLAICGRDPHSLQVAQRKIEATGAEVITIPCDVADRDQVQHLIDSVIHHYGRIDVLVNNAGIITVGPLLTMSRNDYEDTININFWSQVNTTFAVLPHMLARKKGRIVNITSIGGKVSVPHLHPYSAAKFATVGFSEGLRAELAPEGIQVVTVVPGLMRTGSHVNAFMKGKRSAEYGWFGSAATLPFTSVDAPTAARAIVRATRRGDTEVILTIQAKLLTRFHGLFPGLTTDILALVNRVLPRFDQNADLASQKGRDSRGPVSSFLTGLGEAPARRYNQYVTSSNEHKQPAD